MNHRRSVAAVSILAAVAFAACGEADDAGTTTTTNNQAEQSAAQEARAHADALEAWSYYYRVTHPEQRAAAAAPAIVPVTADGAQRRADVEAARAAAAPALVPVTADGAQRRADVEAARAAAAPALVAVTADGAQRRADVEASRVTVTVEHEALRRGVDIKR